MSQGGGLQCRPALGPGGARQARGRPAALPPLARGTGLFERLYQGRTAVERVNGRVQIYGGADGGHITGATRVHACVAAGMVVHVGLGRGGPCRPGARGRWARWP